MSYRDKQYKFIIVTVEDGIATVQFNRPEIMNAYNIEMLEERNEAYAEIAADPEIQVVITSGNKRAFCAGGDLKSLANYSVQEAREFADKVVAGENIVFNMPKPTIAMVAGACMGEGLETILAHDLKIAAHNAVFSLPQINVGIYPGGGATQHLPQLMPLTKAKELVFLGQKFDANTALEFGILNRVVPLEELQKTTHKIAKMLKHKPGFALRMAKEALNAAWSTSLDKGLQLETHGYTLCYGTQDQKEGMAAFLEKRRPVFHGK